MLLETFPLSFRISSKFNNALHHSPFFEWVSVFPFSGLVIFLAYLGIMECLPEVPKHFADDFNRFVAEEHFRVQFGALAGSNGGLRSSISRTRVEDNDVIYQASFGCFSLYICHKGS